MAAEEPLLTPTRMGLLILLWGLSVLVVLALIVAVIG